MGKFIGVGIIGVDREFCEFVPGIEIIQIQIGHTDPLPSCTREPRPRLRIFVSSWPVCWPARGWYPNRFVRIRGRPIQNVGDGPDWQSGCLHFGCHARL